MKRVRADAIWNKGPDLIDDDGEVRELTREDMKTFRPFSELPIEMQEKLLALKRGPVTFRALKEEEVTVKLSGTVLEGLRATGTGWEGRIDQALREWLEQQKAS